MKTDEIAVIMFSPTYKEIGPNNNLNSIVKNEHVINKLVFGLGLAWQKKKKRVKVRSTACHYAAKNRPVQIAMYVSFVIIVKSKLSKFTTNFVRCAILNILNCLTKNFEP